MRILFLGILHFFSVSVFAVTYTVNSTGDGAGGGGFSGTLRYCITAANLTTGVPDNIVFNITGAAKQIITCGSALPAITDRLTIDGSTQDIFINSIYNGIPVISIQGSGLNFSTGSDGSSAISLHIQVTSNPIYITSNNMSVRGCYINTDFNSPTSDDYSSVLGFSGIYAQNVTGLVIGGASPDLSNVIYGQSAIMMLGCTNPIVRNNFINVNRAGVMPAGTPGQIIYHGVELNSGVTGALIDGNIIGNGATDGVYFNNSNGNTISYNTIGFDPVTSKGAPNGRGILFNANSNNNIISFNTIANNYNYIPFSTMGPGLSSGSNSSNNLFTQNSFFCNEGGAITLGGGNGNKQPPTFLPNVYMSLTPTLTGKAQPGDIIEIYKSDACAFGPQGETFVISVPADPTTGDWSYTGGTFTSGTTLTATATSATNNTSAFSAVATIVDCSTYSANAGPDVIATCYTGFEVTLNGTISGPGAGAKWTTNDGQGYFNPSSTSAGTSYTPSVDDNTHANFTLTLTVIPPNSCPQVSDDKVVSFVSPMAIATSQNICKSAAGSVVLNGQVYNSPGGTWSVTGSTTGSFTNATDLGTAFIPSASDTAAGFATLILTPDPFGACPVLSKSVTINFDNIPIADAGTDKTVCGKQDVLLDGQASNASSGYFNTITSTGTFMFGNSFFLFGSYPTYQPSDDDVSAGSINLEITAYNGSCTSTDMVTITFLPGAILDLTSLPTGVCSNTSGVQLNAAINGVSDFTWSSSGSGSFIPDNKTANPIYIPSTSDTTDGAVLLTLDATPDCGGSASQQHNLSFFRAPIVDAGPDQNICLGGISAMVTLNGQIASASGGNWSTSGAGSFSPDENYVPATSFLPASNPDYLPAGDTITGTTTLVLTSSNNTCIITDEVVITYTSGATIDLTGNPISVCSNTSGIQLSSVISNQSDFTWSAIGSGVFMPDNKDPNPIFIPSADDIFGGSVTIRLDATSSCGSTPSQQLNIAILKTPTVDAGPDQTICLGNSPGLVTLNGQVTDPDGGIWTTSGTGTFSPDGNLIPGKPSINPGYLPSGDTLADTLVLTSTGNACIVTDEMVITYAKGVVMDLSGNPNGVCSNATSIQLGAILTDAADFTWSASGDGTFIDETTKTPQYIPSVSDTLNGSVDITLSATSHCGLVTSQQFNIAFLLAPTLFAGRDTVICQGNSLLLNKGSVVGANAVKWSSAGKGKFLPSDDVLEVTYVPSPTDYKKIAVTLSLSATLVGCASSQDNLLAILLPKPSVGVGSTQLVCPDTKVTLNAVEVGIDQIGLWTVASGSSGQISDPSNNNTEVINITAEKNKYIWTITDTSTRCSNSAEYIVNHCYYPPLTVYNALSPNDDGLGEFLEIKNIDSYKNNKVSVFNRWGEMVFKVDNYDNTKDNVFKGKSNIGTVQDLPNGSYYYVIDKGVEGSKPEKGFLVIQK